MSEAEGFDPADYGLQEQTEQISRRQKRRLEAAEREKDELKSKVAEMERREVFRDAGINPNDPAAKYFVKAYDGELSPEAIKAAAVEAKIIAGSQIPPEERQAHEAAIAAANGASPPDPAADARAKLAELSKKTFGPNDEMGRAAHMAEIARLARESGAHIPIS